jgi:hypothetical protein
MRVNLRFWTTITMIAICGFAVFRGLSIVQFSFVTANLGSAEQRAEILNRWSTAPGIGLEALQSQLTQRIDPSDLKSANSRREALAAILSIKPLSSSDWLSLSGMQLITDQPMEQVLAGLMLSTVTGPNEGYVMADRGIFSVSLWEDLSPDLKRHVASDLSAGEMPDSVKFRAVLSTKSGTVRNELRKAMLATGLSPKEVELRLGL